MTFTLLPVSSPLETKTVGLFDLVIESRVLRDNPLKDSPRRHNYVLVPKTKKKLPVVVHLAGYFGNGTQSFNIKTLEDNFPQMMILQMEEGKLPLAIHCFVDAMTSLGGSQFINSEGCGKYSDYIQHELTEALKKSLDTDKHWVVVGSSSGGYGALHHVSVEDSPFATAVSIAPDSFFEVSLLSEYHKVAPWLAQYPKVDQVLNAIKNGELKKNKNYFQILNAVAMACCYGSVKKGKISYPIDLQTGEIVPKTWKDFLQKDPVHFLIERKKVLKNKKIFLSVGKYDEFTLYFGARKLKSILEKSSQLHYSEFSGGHFNLSEQKLQCLQLAL